MSNEVIKKKKTSETTPKKKKNSWGKKFFSLSNVCIILAVLFLVIIGVVISSTIRKGAASAKEAYEDARDTASAEAYNRFYETAFDSAERDYHVANRVAIEVGSIKEEAQLEVLCVNDVEYVIESKNDTPNGEEVWMEFQGKGLFTVNMKASEFVIDSDRQYVLVRVPRPELTKIDITQAKQLFWRGGTFLRNGSISDGTDLAIEMRKAGQTKLQNYMKSNPQFYKSAKGSAQVIIEELVKGLNPELPNLTVEVEFVD